MQAIVLVGGEGTRLRPLTEVVPKPALTLVDRPFLAYMIEWLAGHGVTEVVLACGFLPDALREALGDGGEWAGVKLTYVVEPEPLGTAGAIRFAADSLGEELDETFLALNGDVLTDLDISALLAAHRDRGATASLGLYPVEDASAFGLVTRDEDDSVLEFIEKTGRVEPGEVNAGIYVLERPVLDLIAAGENVSIERQVFPRLVGAGLFALPLSGYWVDIGTPERYMQAGWDILERVVETRVEPSAPGLFVSPEAEVSSEASVGPRAVVSAGCRVEAGARVSDSVLLADCVVGAGASVTGSVLAAAASVAPGALAEGVIAAAGERIA